MDKTDKQQSIDLVKIARTLWQKKKVFLKIWVITFILSCVWILPQPRYYTSEVKLAPEFGGDNMAGGLSSIASSFGVSIGGVSGQDAIYPELYPELFENPEFIVGLYDIQVKTADGEVSTTYFTYLKKHQKKNPLTAPFNKATRWVKGFFEEEDTTHRGTGSSDINPFRMNEKDYNLMKGVMESINCAVDMKNSVITISVTDQDPLICATMADSVREHLQAYITRYRTSKTLEDMKHYQQMRDSAEVEYEQAMNAYSRFCDTHKDIILQSFQSERDKLEGELSLKQNALTAMEMQLQNTKVKLQERTPAFTILKSPIVPVKPAGPKRMLFVLGMLIMATLVGGLWMVRKEIFPFNQQQ